MADVSRRLKRRTSLVYGAGSRSEISRQGSLESLALRNDAASASHVSLATLDPKPWSPIPRNPPASGDACLDDDVSDDDLYS